MKKRAFRALASIVSLFLGIIAIYRWMTGQSFLEFVIALGAVSLVYIVYNWRYASSATNLKKIQRGILGAMVGWVLTWLILGVALPLMTGESVDKADISYTFYPVLVFFVPALVVVLGLRWAVYVRGRQSRNK